MKKKLKAYSKEVEISIYVEIDGVEREIVASYYVTPEQVKTYNDPYFPAEAEFQSAMFTDTMEDASAHFNPEYYECEAIEKFDEDLEAEYEQYCEMKMRKRWEA